MDYLIFWISMLGVVNWVAIGAVFLAFALEKDGRVEQKASSFRGFAEIAALLLIMVVTITTVAQLGKLHPGSYWSNNMEFVSNQLSDYLDQESIKKPLIDVRTHDTWPLAAGLITQLYKSGADFSVAEKWKFMFGDDLIPNGSEDAIIVVGAGDLQDKAKGRADYHLVSHRDNIYVGNIYVYHHDPKYVEHHKYQGEVHVVEAINMLGNAGVVVDGNIPKEGSNWNSGECFVFSGFESFVTFEVPNQGVTGMVISLDNNDSYRVLCSANGVKFRKIGIIPPVNSHGMRERLFFSNQLGACRYLRIEPNSGDGSFSMGEIVFLVK